MTPSVLPDVPLVTPDGDVVRTDALFRGEGAVLVFLRHLG